MPQPTSRVSKAKVHAGCLFIGIVGLLVALLVRAHTVSPGLSAQFLRYTVTNGGFPPMAILRITNSAECTWLIPMTIDDPPFGPDDSISVECLFSNKTAKGWTYGSSMPVGESRVFDFMYLDPHSSLDVAVPLAETGVPRKVAIICIQDFYRSSRYVDQVLWPVQYRLPSRYKFRPVKVVWCEHELIWPTNTRPATLPPMKPPNGE